MRYFPLLILAMLVAVPTASALVLQVSSPFAVDGSVHKQTFHKQNGIEFSFNFDPAIYNTTGFDNRSIREATITADYFVEEVTAEGFFNFWKKVAGTVNQEREYRSTWVISNAEYLNVTTLFKRQSGFLQGFSFEICNTVTFFANGTTYGAGTSCEANTLGGSPNHLTHIAKFGHVFDQGNRTGFVVRIFTDETRSGGSLITSDNLLIANGTIAPHITSVIGSLQNLAQDASTTNVKWLFTTFDNHASVTAQVANANDACKDNRGFVSAVGQTLLHWATFGSSPECFSAEDAINFVFGFVNKVLAVVFGFFPGGDKLAAFITQLFAIVVGIPLYATTLFLGAPFKSLVYWTFYFTLIGIVRFASSQQAGFDVIYQTPLVIWTGIFKGIQRFAVWTYEMVVKIATAIGNILPG